MFIWQKKTEEDRELQRSVIRSNVAENSSFDQAYVVMNLLSTIVACYGLLADSAAVVIGAMIVAMLLGQMSGKGPLFSPEDLTSDDVK